MFCDQVELQVEFCGQIRLLIGILLCRIVDYVFWLNRVNDLVLQVGGVDG